MERTTGGRIGRTSSDNLLSKLYPQEDSFIVELKTPGAYARGTVMSRESDGTYEVLGNGSGTASVILADPTLSDDSSAVAYRSGHFNRNALIVKGGYELTAEDENNLRNAGIFLSDALGVRDAEAEEADDNSNSGDNGSSDETVYTEEQLNAMTVEQIKTLAAEKGYTITKTTKADIIAEFLAAQGE